MPSKDRSQKSHLDLFQGITVSYILKHAKKKKDIQVFVQYTEISHAGTSFTNVPVQEQL